MSRRSALPAPAIGVEELARLQAAAAWLTRKAPLPAILTGILAACGQSLGARAQAIRLIEDRSAVLRLSAVWCAPEDGPPAAALTTAGLATAGLSDDVEHAADSQGAVSRQVDRWAPLLTPATCVEAARRGELVAWEDLAEPAEAAQPAPPVLPPGARTVWSLPITGQEGRLLGTLATYARRPGRPAPAAVQLARLYAGYAGLAIEQSRLRDRLASIESERESERGSERHSERGSDDALAGDLAENRRLAAALEAISEAVCLVDLKGRILYVNEADARLFGYTREELIGRSAAIYYADPAHGREIARRTLAGGFRGEATGRRKDGSRVRILLSTALVRDAAGQPTAMVGVAHDLTERLAFEAKVRETEKLTALARLASGVAHNFNNLLAVILGNAELVLEGELLPEQRPRLEAIVAASLNGAQAVKRLQEFTRQRPEMSSRPVDLAEIARAAIGVARPAWHDRPAREGRQIALIEAVETAVISGDEGSLRDVAANLIINAAEAIAGNGTIEVRTGTRAGEAYLAVTNTGAGLGEEARARLFEPFFTTKDSGAGLGLASSFGIVQQHGGRIDVETQPGSGTTFTIVLPRTISVHSKRKQALD